MTAMPTPRYGEHGKSAKEFLKDGHFIRVLIGGRGAGKSFTVAEDVARHIWRNAGAKAIIARETEVSQADSSIDTFRAFFDTLGNAYSEEFGLFKSWNNGRTFRLPSKLAIDRMQAECGKMIPQQVNAWIEATGDKLCGYVEFRGLPAAEKGKFRGMECSYLALIEADQIIERQYALGLACLRWKGADASRCDEKGFIRDRCVVLDTNPPSPNHWIAEFEKRELLKPENERTARFWHIPTYENEHNLPENYIRDTILTPYASNPDMIERMLYGRYADAFTGKPVCYAFREAEHAAEDLDWPKGAYLVRGHDFGTSNATTFSAYWMDGGTEYWHCLAEQYLEGSDSESQARGIVAMTAAEFPFALPSWKGDQVCAGVLDFCDPSGDNSNFSTKSTGSSVKIFNTNGIYPGTLLWNRGIAIGLTLINRMLEKRDGRGRSIFKVDKKNCPVLYRAIKGGYRYPNVGESGYGKDEPLKGTVGQEFDYSHIFDSIRYPVMNCMKLLRTEFMRAKQPTNLVTRRNINPVRTF